MKISFEQRFQIRNILEDFLYSSNINEQKNIKPSQKENNESDNPKTKIQKSELILSFNDLNLQSLIIFDDKTLKDILQTKDIKFKYNIYYLLEEFCITNSFIKYILQFQVYFQIQNEILNVIDNINVTDYLDHLKLNNSITIQDIDPDLFFSARKIHFYKEINFFNTNRRHISSFIKALELFEYEKISDEINKDIKNYLNHFYNNLSLQIKDFIVKKDKNLI